MEPFELPSPRIAFIDLPALDLHHDDPVVVCVELDAVPVNAWWTELQAALTRGSEQLKKSAPRLIKSYIAFDSSPAAARDLCDELRVLVDITTQKLLGFS
jgi:hypothetical protein